MSNTAGAAAYEPIIELPRADEPIDLALSAPVSRLRVRNPDGRLGGATAEFRDGTEERSWSAKHSWDEGAGADRCRVLEFDEPLPAGQIRLRIQSR
jgi:hypothetical protein